LFEDLVRHRFADRNHGDLRDDVVQALDVLDVERRVDVDPRRQEIVDILPAFGVRGPLGVGVGELVDEENLRTPGEGPSRSNS